MDNELKKILISRTDANFLSRVRMLRLAIMQAARFQQDDIRSIQLSSIVQEVLRRGDKAVSEFTEKYDGVKLDPSEFRVKDSELQKAHRNSK